MTYYVLDTIINVIDIFSYLLTYRTLGSEDETEYQLNWGSSTTESYNILSINGVLVGCWLILAQTQKLTTG
jgi:hypothetical protein